ncbi:basic proline-rich protein-like [Sarcophilus harrisii]|uniref:basic proline-rich protein-like n=1 Tax=Sarcophilus harrisii TaxID=9305 RepID=UPI001301BFB3|nr:basic proline-rich protein-like [Sarcophilus harrisii]
MDPKSQAWQKGARAPPPRRPPQSQSQDLGNKSFPRRPPTALARAARCSPREEAGDGPGERPHSQPPKGSSSCRPPASGAGPPIPPPRARGSESGRGAAGEPERGSEREETPDLAEALEGHWQRPTRTELLQPPVSQGQGQAPNPCPPPKPRLLSGERIILPSGKPPGEPPPLREPPPFPLPRSGSPHCPAACLCPGSLPPPLPPRGASAPGLFGGRWSPPRCPRGSGRRLLLSQRNNASDAPAPAPAPAPGKRVASLCARDRAPLAGRLRRPEVGGPPAPAPQTRPRAGGGALVTWADSNPAAPPPAPAGLHSPPARSLAPPPPSPARSSPAAEPSRTQSGARTGRAPQPGPPGSPGSRSRTRPQPRSPLARRKPALLPRRPRDPAALVGRRSGGPGEQTLWERGGRHRGPGPEELTTGMPGSGAGAKVADEAPGRGRASG